MRRPSANLRDLVAEPIVSDGSTHRSRRKGAIVAEMAVITPILCLLTFGAIQVANTLHFKQKLTSSVFEGVRMVGSGEADRTKIESRVLALLTARNVKGATVSISPAGDLAALAPGSVVSVNVVAPISRNVTGPNLVVFKNQLSVVGKTVR